MKHQNSSTSASRVFVGCCVASCLVLATCSAAIERKGSSITVQYPADEAAVGPNFDLPAQFLVFLPLVARNAEGKLEGRLAPYQSGDRYEHGATADEQKQAPPHEVMTTIDLTARGEVSGSIDRRGLGQLVRPDDIDGGQHQDQPGQAKHELA